MKADFTNMMQKLQKVERYLDGGIHDHVGVESENHFKESFQNEGFTDDHLIKWKEVERRKPHSPWHGFQLGNNKNFSPAATKRKILTGNTMNLSESITYRKNGRRVIITAGTKYAKIHNEGGSFKVFGKTPATMPQRQFMGDSKVLRDKINKTVKNHINRLMK